MEKVHIIADTWARGEGATDFENLVYKTYKFEQVLCASVGYDEYTALKYWIRAKPQYFGENLF